MPAAKPPRAVFLTGFMGAGKTSVGRALAVRLGWSFVDLDQRVEQKAGRSIAALFRNAGEGAFRAAESAAFEELLAQAAYSATVAALGGGTLSQPQNAERMRNAAAALVFLDAPLEVLWRRCRPQASQRPLFADEAAFRRLYESRLMDYRSAPLRVDTAGRTPEDVAAEIAVVLRLERRTEPDRR